MSGKRGNRFFPLFPRTAKRQKTWPATHQTESRSHRSLHQSVFIKPVPFPDARPYARTRKTATANRKHQNLNSSVISTAMLNHKAENRYKNRNPASDTSPKSDTVTTPRRKQTFPHGLRPCPFSSPRSCQNRSSWEHAMRGDGETAKTSRRSRSKTVLPNPTKRCSPVPPRPVQCVRAAERPGMAGRCPGPAAGKKACDREKTSGWDRRLPFSPNRGLRHSPSNRLADRKTPPATLSKPKRR